MEHKNNAASGGGNIWRYLQPMAKKIKLSDAAKDISVSSQELIDYFASSGDNKKKAGSALTEEEMNQVLEHYTKLHEVSSFSGFFAGAGFFSSAAALGASVFAGRASLAEAK